MNTKRPIGDDTVVVGIGEALFDCFDDRVKLGGAPVNFAVHAHQLITPRGGRGAVVSRIGNDQLGSQLIEQLTKRGLITSHIQRDGALPTGVVKVSIGDDGQPSYEITENVAWDNLQWDPELEQLASECAAVCFGTLAQRSESSHATIQRFLAAATGAVRLLDVNLRQHYFSADLIATSMQAATAVKLSADELMAVGKLLSLSDASSATDELALGLCNRFDLELLAMTRGAAGTVIYSSGQRFEGEPAPFHPKSGADSVGAGDSCCAGVLYGILAGWPPERTVTLANRIGAYVAAQPGATPQLPEELLP